MDPLYGVVCAMSVGMIGWYGVLVGSSLRRRSSEDKRREREERARRRDTDWRRNVGARFYNALSKAAEQSTAAGLIVRKNDHTDAYIVHVDARKGSRFVRLLTVVVKVTHRELEVTVDGERYSWTRSTGPQEFMVDRLLPSLVGIVSSYNADE